MTYKQIQDKLDLVTDNGPWIKTTIYDLGVVMAQFEIVKSMELQTFNKKMTAAPVFFNLKNESIEKTQSVLLKLLDDIDNNKIETNKINAVIDITNTVIKTEKLKIEMVSSMNNLSKNA